MNGTAHARALSARGWLKTPARKGSRRSARRAAARPGTGGFTLMESMLALGISAVVLAGIGGVFFSAMRLRERTSALVDSTQPLQHALAYVRRDLRGILPPGGALAGDFRCGSVVSGAGEVVGLQFFTTTGRLEDDAPWGDVQEVTYELRAPTVNTNGAGRQLIRTVTRNLLATMAPDYQEEPLLENIDTLAFECFDGQEWRDNWDTSLGDTNVPSAVRLRLQLVSDPSADLRQRQPVELIVPLMVQSRTNRVQAEETTGGGE